MITMPLDPIIVHIGPFALRWYSLIVLCAIFIGLWIGAREAERKGFDKEAIYNDALVVVIAGIAGARLFHVIDHWSHEFAANPIRALFIWEGGLAIWGGVIGGLIAVMIVARQRGYRFLILTDALAPGLVLGQGLGRIACLITGDAMGKPTSGPLGIAYSNPNAMVPELGVYYTPTPLFELLMNVSIFAVLWYLRRRSLPNGALAMIYLILYASGRFVVSLWSSYEIVLFGLNQAQLVGMLAIIVAMPYLIFLLLRQRRAAFAFISQ